MKEKETKMVETEITRKLRTARRAGVPVIILSTTDQYVMIDTIRRVVNGDRAIITHDIIRGFLACNKTAEENNTIQKITGDTDPISFLNPPEALSAIGNAQISDAYILMYNSHKYISEPAPLQGIQNIRDKFKGSSCTLILMGVQITVPLELSNDVYVINDELPDEKERKGIIENLINDNGLSKTVTENNIASATSATRGLNAFAVEQITALSLSKTGLNQNELYNRWKTTINSIPGLTLDDSKVSLDDIGGCEGVKEFAKKLTNGKNPPKLIIYIDEIEKAMAGSSGSYGDTSGVSQAILGKMLTFMQDYNCRGQILVGVPGAGKSLTATALANIGSSPIPVIRWDIGSTKGSLVGQSEAQTDRVIQTFKNFAGAGEILIVATCNSESALPPELKRRFQFGMWFYDLPTKSERESIWKIYKNKFKEVDYSEMPNDEGWTGAEIKTCCDIAWQLNITPKEAARWIVPVAKMAVEKIENLRKQANGRWLSASYPGPYQINKKEEINEVKIRKMELS